MARVTIEDCLERVENRFALVHAAAKRTKQLYKGSHPLIPCKNREVVTALREIADGKVRFENLEPEPEKKTSRRSKAKTQ